MKSILFAVLTCCLTTVLCGQQYLIKFATVAPEGSTWMNVMKEYDQAVRKESNGRVGFKIYAGGVAGDELDVLRKIRLGQYHSAGFTGVGMGRIAPVVRILDSPFLFQNHQEVDYIVANFDAEIRKAFDDAGFIVLGWAEVGYVYVFTNKPIYKVRDMDGVKMWMWEGDPVAEAAFKAFEISPMPLSLTDVLTSLQTGLVDGFYTSPLAAVSLQWFTAVKFMFEVPLTNSMGAVLVSKREYEKMPEDCREILLRNGATYMRKLTELSRKDNDRSLLILKKNKITFTKPFSQKDFEQYDQVGKTARKSLSGKLFTEDLLQRVEKSLFDFRTSQKGLK